MAAGPPKTSASKLSKVAHGPGSGAVWAVMYLAVRGGEEGARRQQARRVRGLVAVGADDALEPLAARVALEHGAAADVGRRDVARVSGDVDALNRAVGLAAEGHDAAGERARRQAGKDPSRALTKAAVAGSVTVAPSDRTIAAGLPCELTSDLRLREIVARADVARCLHPR